jgi:hypothetical protein
MEKFEGSLTQLREEKSDLQQRAMKLDAEKRTLQDRLDVGFMFIPSFSSFHLSFMITPMLLSMSLININIC